MIVNQKTVKNFRTQFIPQGRKVTPEKEKKKKNPALFHSVNATVGGQRESQLRKNPKQPQSWCFQTPKY